MIFPLRLQLTCHRMSGVSGEEKIMSTPGPATPVKPVVSMLLAREDLGPALVERLAEYFGPPDLVGPWWPFDATAYYTSEMGPNLGRRLVSFLHLADPARLADWKVFTNELEQAFSLGERRLANLDPGYLARERLVLATGKNFPHRIYLDHGIYGDLTLIYDARAAFSPCPGATRITPRGSCRRCWNWCAKNISGNSRRWRIETRVWKLPLISG